MYLICFLIRKISFYGVQIRILGRPEIRRCNGSSVLNLRGAVRHDGGLRYRFAHEFSRGVKDDIRDSDQTVSVCRVCQFVYNFKISAFLRHARRVEKDTIFYRIDFLRNGQCDAASDARACKPARIRQFPAVNIHTDNIIAVKVEAIGHIIAKRTVAVWALAKIG